MATNDVSIFDEAMAYILDGDWASTDDIKVAIVRNTVIPVVTQASPAFSTYTEVTASTTYLTGGTSIGTWGSVITQSAGVTKMDSTTDPSWALDAGGDTLAYWGIIYNDTQAGKPAIGFIDLGGPIDMTAEAINLVWAAAGIFTITKV